MDSLPLKVQGLANSFGTNRAVDSVSFDVRAGEIYGLLGPNGAGKTTMISIISGLIQPDAGQVEVAGMQFSSTPQQARYILKVLVPPTFTPRYLALAIKNLEYMGKILSLALPFAALHADYVTYLVGACVMLSLGAILLIGIRRRK
jgi:ABC-2 type transport system ATP-binding protein